MQRLARRAAALRRAGSPGRAGAGAAAAATRGGLGAPGAGHPGPVAVEVGPEGAGARLDAFLQGAVPAAGPGAAQVRGADGPAADPPRTLSSAVRCCSRYRNKQTMWLGGNLRLLLRERECPAED